MCAKQLKFIVEAVTIAVVAAFAFSVFSYFSFYHISAIISRSKHCPNGRKYTNIQQITCNVG